MFYFIAVHHFSRTIFSYYGFQSASSTFVIQQLERPFSQITSYLNYYLVDLRKTDQENQLYVYNNTIVDIFLLNTEAFSLDT